MKHAAICVALAALCWAVYGSVGHYDFVNYDDDIYLLNNDRLHDGLTVENAMWAVTTFHHSNWHPVTWLSWMLDVSLFGFSPGVFHIGNALLHAVNAWLIYGLFTLLTGARKPSFVVAALFAIHPLHVESVAWISERKDLLSTLFWLLTTLAYVHWTKRPSGARYALILSLFLLGLMAKPMLVTLPFTLILLDYWPLGRLAKREDLLARFREKWLLFVGVAASIVITYRAQQAGGALRDVSALPILTRVENSIVAYTDYLFHTIWPMNLSPFYPYLDEEILGLQAVLAGLPLVVITAFAVTQVRRRPYILFGWLWYLGTLVPVIGLIQVGEQAMADRYTYVPLLGIFVAATWALWERCEQSPRGLNVFLTTSAIACAALTTAAALQASYWKDSIQLFEHAVSVSENNHVAHNNLGVALQAAGEPGSESHFRRALEIQPGNADALSNLGSASLERGAFKEATAYYLDALQFRAADADAYANLGASLLPQGRYEEALGAYSQAVILRPEDMRIRVGLGNAYLQAGAYSDAEREYSLVLETRPDAVETRCNIAVALINQGRPHEATIHTGHVLSSDPENLSALYNQGVALAKLNDHVAAAEAFSQVLAIEPSHKQAAENLQHLVEK